VVIHVSLSSVVLLVGALLGIPVVIGRERRQPRRELWRARRDPRQIRTVESGGDYTSPPNDGGASGAYHYVDSTWNGSGGYEGAYLAPPEVQDARAANDVQAVLAPTATSPSSPSSGTGLEPQPTPHNLTPCPCPEPATGSPSAEYQTRWLAVYETECAAATPGACFAPASADGVRAPTLDGPATTR
jgi:hypothetical protein